MEVNAEAKKILEILDKHVNQEAFAKEVVGVYVMPWLDGTKAKLESGEIDLIPGTDLDKHVLLTAIEFLKKQVAA